MPTYAIMNAFQWVIPMRHSNDKPEICEQELSQNSIFAPC